MADRHSNDPHPPSETPPGERTAAPDPGGPVAIDELYRICIDSAPYGVLIHEPAGRILLYNRRLELITGYSCEEIPDIPAWIETIYPDPAYRSLVIQAREDADVEASVRTREAMITRKDGQVRMCRFTSSRTSDGLRVVFIRDVYQGLEVDPETTTDAVAPRKTPLALLSWASRGDGFFLCGFNEAAEKWSGGGLAGRLATEVGELFPGREDLREDMRRCLNNRISLRRKMLFPFRHQGEDAYVAATYTFSPPVFISLQLEDLTDLLRAEKRLAQSERKFIEFADMLPEIVFETDLQGSLLFVNRSGLELMGYTAEDLQRGISAFDCISPEDRPRAEANFREVLRGADLGVNEYTLVRRDGRTFTGLLRSRLLVEGGTPRGLRGFIIDVSERKQIEAALQDSELRLRLAVEAAQIGIYSTDLETDQRQWSPELYAIVGRAPGTILTEQEAWSIVHPEDQARVLETHRQALNPAGDGRFYSEHRIVRPDGEVRWIVWMGRTFFRETSNGRVPTRRLGACIDVTERKQAEDELKRSHKELEQRVAERTAELTAANQRLKQQIEQRLAIEKKLRAREAELKNKTDELLEINTALKVLLKKRDEDQREAKEKIAAHLKRMVLPYLEKLMRSKLPSRSRTYAGMLASNLKDIASPFAKSLADNLYNLTPTELRVASLIQLGQSSKEIAAELNLSPKTVEFHRYNIRRKLGLGKKRLNLQSFLKTMK